MSIHFSREGANLVDVGACFFVSCRVVSGIDYPGFFLPCSSFLDEPLI